MLIKMRMGMRLEICMELGLEIDQARARAGTGNWGWGCDPEWGMVLGIGLGMGQGLGIVLGMGQGIGIRMGWLCLLNIQMKTEKPALARKSRKGVYNHKNYFLFLKNMSTLWLSPSIPDRPPTGYIFSLYTSRYIS